MITKVTEEYVSRSDTILTFSFVTVTNNELKQPVETVLMFIRSYTR